MRLPKNHRDLLEKFLSLGTIRQNVLLFLLPYICPEKGEFDYKGKV